MTALAGLFAVPELIDEPLRVTSALGTMEIVFLSLWALFSVLFWATYRRDENILSAAIKVGCLLGFVYGLMLGFDWIAEKVQPDQRIALFGEDISAEGPRIPALANVFFWFVIGLLVLVAWYARDKFSTAGALLLSSWDRGNWFMMPVLFVLMTVGLLLVAAAASPVLSPFIYTLF